MLLNQLLQWLLLGKLTQYKNRQRRLNLLNRLTHQKIYVINRCHSAQTTHYLLKAMRFMQLASLIYLATALAGTALWLSE